MACHVCVSLQDSFVTIKISPTWALATHWSINKTRLVLVQLMACHLFITRLLSEPMMIYFYFQSSSIELLLEINIFDVRIRNVIIERYRKYVPPITFSQKTMFANDDHITQASGIKKSQTLLIFGNAALKSLTLKKVLFIYVLFIGHNVTVP